MKKVWILTRGGDERCYDNVTYLNVYVSGGIAIASLFIGDALDPVIINNVLDVTADRD